MDYQSWYRDLSARFRSEIAVQAINVLDRGLVFFIAAAYIGAAVYLAVTQDLRLVKFLLAPAVSFAVVTYLRTRFDSPRPYELYDIKPIIAKNTRGKSLPSRHVASAVAIACALTWVNMDWGFIAFACSIVVMFTRIVGGVHFPRDVAAGALLSLVIGVIAYVLIP